MPRRLLRKFLPNPHHVREHRVLKWLGPLLHHPRLWHVSRNGIALGCAVGVFFGVLLPVAQMPAAALFAIFMRANLPMAVAGTFITNPFTFAPVYYLAYKMGVLVSGQDMGMALLVPSPVDEAGQGWISAWIQRVRDLGRPLLVGLPLLATLSSMLTYLLVNRLWRAYAIRLWNKRRTVRAARS